MQFNWKKKKTKQQIAERKKKYKNSKRSKETTPALDKSRNLKSRVDLIDYDYINKLSKEEKIWLNAFTEGWINADFRNPITDKMFKEIEEKQFCYSMNNARNRCIYTKAKTNGMVVDTVGFEKDRKNNSLKEFNDFYNSSNNSTKNTKKNKKLS